MLEGSGSRHSARSTCLPCTQRSNPHPDAVTRHTEENRDLPQTEAFWPHHLLHDHSPGTVLPSAHQDIGSIFTSGSVCNQLSFPEVPTGLANKEKHLALPRKLCRCCYVYKCTAMHTWHTPDSKLTSSLVDSSALPPLHVYAHNCHVCSSSLGRAEPLPEPVMEGTWPFAAIYTSGT